MPSAQFREARTIVRRALERIGYARANLRNEYEFADLLGESPRTLSAPLVGFLGRPFTYASAAFALVDVDIHPQAMRSLGAPLVFQRTGTSLVQWKLTTDGATPLDEIPLDDFERAVEERRTLWSPAAISRSKSARFQLSPRQLDFIDVGLLPTIDAEARKKLDELLNRAVASARAELAEHSAVFDEQQADETVSEVVFRFVAAKLLADRGDKAELAAMTASQVSQTVQTEYFGDGPFRRSPEVRAAEQTVWALLRDSFSFANLSVDTLAYIYENTLVPEAVRRERGVHGTPPEIARYVLARLPIEELELEQRSVLEPFAGHAVFLVAALARLRELAPEDWKRRQEHEYLKRMLVGLELDPFAVEVSRLSLMLADYPNPDGWNLVRGDAFEGDTLTRLSRGTSVVVGNPPFEEFTPAERAKYGKLRGTGKAQEALTRIVESRPEMLGLIMPKAFLSGAHYREQRRRLVETYGEIEAIELPDNVFAHAGTETVVLTAWAPSRPRIHLRHGSVAKPELHAFLTSGRFTVSEAMPVPHDLAPEFDIRVPALGHLWVELHDAPRLGDHARIHRGVEWVSAQARRAAQEAQDGFVPGLLRVPTNLTPYVQPSVEYIEMTPSEMRGGASARAWSEPKVVVNAVRRSRGPWKITAFPDREGLTVSQNFTAVWPETGLPVEVVAAVLNGPVANAFVHTRMSGKHVNIESLDAIPLPNLTPTESLALIAKVEQYRTAAALGREPEILNRLLIEIDAAVLAAYRLTPRTEHDLLRFFDGQRRPGVEHFLGYPGADIDAALPLKLVLSARRMRGAAVTGALHRVSDPDLRAAIAGLR